MLTWCAAGFKTRHPDTADERGDPLYRLHRLLIIASECLDFRGEERIQALLRASDPYGEVRNTWYAKENIR